MVWGFRASGFRFGVQGLGLGFRIEDLGFDVQRFRSRVKDLGIRVQGICFGV
jgi:hypothetical protein